MERSNQKRKFLHYSLFFIFSSLAQVCYQNTAVRLFFNSIDIVVAKQIHILAIDVEVSQSDGYECDGNATEISWQQVDGSEDLPYEITFQNSADFSKF